MDATLRRVGQDPEELAGLGMFRTAYRSVEFALKETEDLARQLRDVGDTV